MFRWITAFSLIAVLASAGAALVGEETPSIETVQPVVVKTSPEAGSDDVNPNLKEIKVTFSKPMKDKSWSWSTAWQDSSPEFRGTPKYSKDGRTCTAQVKLEPGRTYGFWLNSNKFKGFQDAGGRAAVPYLYVFKTKGKAK